MTTKPSETIASLVRYIPLCKRMYKLLNHILVKWEIKETSKEADAISASSLWTKNNGKHCSKERQFLLWNWHCDEKNIGISCNYIVSSEALGSTGLLPAAFLSLLFHLVLLNLVRVISFAFVWLSMLLHRRQTERWTWILFPYVAFTSSKKALTDHFSRSPYSK